MTDLSKGIMAAINDKTTAGETYEAVGYVKQICLAFEKRIFLAVLQSYCELLWSHVVPYLF